MADIEWERWEPSPVMTHLDQSCTKCLYSGPLLARFGKTRRPATRTRRLVQRSKITEGQRPKAITEYQAARMLRTHWASRCQSCGEEVVYLMEPWAEVPELYRSPDFDLAKHARLDQPALFDVEVDMTKPKPLTPWQEHLPDELPRHIRRNIAPSESGCWMWQRSTSPDGYGWASLDNRTHQAHRLVYLLLRGDPGKGLVLDHLCHTKRCSGGNACPHRRCVNPEHLEPVTNRENLHRGNTTTGATTCKKGHELSPYGNQRRCLVCLRAYGREASRKRRARLKEANSHVN